MLNPKRASKLVADWNRKKVDMPFSDAKAGKQALRYATTYTRYKTVGGQMDLATKLLSVRSRVMSRFFENMPQYTKAGKTMSYARFFLDRHLKGSSWAQTAHDYLGDRRKQEHCGLFNGRNNCVR